MTETLDRGKIGHSYRVLSFDGLAEPTMRRLESVGMTPGVVVDVLNNKSHGTVIVRLRESRWAMGSTITEHIQVEPADPQAPGWRRPVFSVEEASCVIGHDGTPSVAARGAKRQGREAAR